MAKMKTFTLAEAQRLLAVLKSLLKRAMDGKQVIEEVEKELESMRDRQITWTTVERPAAIGDRVTVDLKLTVEEQSVSDLKDNPVAVAKLHDRLADQEIDLTHR